jgi:hypothetical protein
VLKKLIIEEKILLNGLENDPTKSFISSQTNSFSSLTDKTKLETKILVALFSLSFSIY